VHVAIDRCTGACGLSALVFGQIFNKGGFSMKKCQWMCVPLVLACASGAAFAQGVGVYGVMGSGGVGLGLNAPVSPMVGIRGELASYTGSDTYTEDQITYKGDVKLKGNGVFVDLRPFSGVFRVVGGVGFGGTSAALDAQAADGTVTIDGQKFDATGNTLSARIKYPSTMPYVGIGWGHGRHDQPGWTFAFDVGVSIGKPSVSLTASGGLLAQPGAAAAIAAEQRKVQDDLNSAGVLPSAKLSIGYQF
jgi:hypothetical protein